MLTFACHSVDLSAAPPPAHQDGAGVGWVRLLPGGTIQGRDGRGPYRVNAAAVLAATRAYHRSVDIPIDYDHQTLHSTRTGTKAPAAGWITGLEVRDGDLWGQVRWTAPAQAHIAAGEYRYLSPVIPTDAQGQVRLLHSVGLVNTPNFDLPVVAEHLHAALAHLGDLPVDPELLTALGLDPATTQDAKAACAHAATLAAKAQALDAITADLGLGAETKPDDLPPAIQALAAQAHTHKAGPDPAAYVPRAALDDVLGRLAAVEANQAHSAATTAVEAAMAAGKVSPAMGDWAHSYATKDPAGFAAWANAAPAIITPGAAHAALSAPAAAPAGAAGGLDEAEAHVARQLGIDPAVYAATKAEKEAD